MKVVIVGKGRGYELAPLNGVEIWGITQLILMRHADLVIDMNVYEDGRWGDNELFEARAAKEICRINAIPYVDLNNYPLNDIVDSFDSDYFTNTVDYALALAIYRGYTEIDLYGVAMEYDTEYYSQKAGVEYWIGFAKGRGIKVRVFGEYSTILKTKDNKLYGYDVLQRGV